MELFQRRRGMRGWHVLAKLACASDTDTHDPAKGVTLILAKSRVLESCYKEACVGRAARQQQVTRALGVIMSRRLTNCCRLAAMVLAALGTPLQANDSVAGMALGGLEILRTEAIEMVFEDLHISPDRIEVRYVFRNVTPKPVETLVAFPLPGVGYPNPDYDYIPIPHEDQANYVGFSTRINGEPIALEIEQRALLLGVDC